MDCELKVNLKTGYNKISRRPRSFEFIFEKHMIINAANIRIKIISPSVYGLRFATNQMLIKAI